MPPVAITYREADEAVGTVIFMNLAPPSKVVASVVNVLCQAATTRPRTVLISTTYMVLNTNLVRSFCLAKRLTSSNR